MRQLILVAVVCAMFPMVANAQTDERCFPETGYCISGRIREFWEQNGGLPVFGLPITPQQQETIQGQTLQVQWFERNRLELHPENARPYDVLLGRLGADRLAQQGRDPFTFPTSEPQQGCRYFQETRHNVCSDILANWRASGLDLGEPGVTEGESLALFGLPLSDPMMETLSDGRQYTVQWFERGRFELHPENQPPFNVLLGLLGSEVRAGGPPAPQPPAQPTPPAGPQFVGAGNQVTQPFDLAAGVTLFHLKYTGTGYFGVRLLDAQGEFVELLANDIDAFDGDIVFGLEASGQYLLEIDAEGSWEIRYEQPGPNASGPPAPVTFNGQGKRAASVQLNPGLARFTLTHDGDGYFGVTLYDKNGDYVDLLANEIGPHSGSSASSIDLAGVHWIDIQANGNWTIDIQQ
jgi:hypothetical protein